MAEVGYASLGIIPSFDGFQGKLERGTTPGLLSAGRTGGVRFGSAAGDSAGKRFGSVFKSAAKASLIGLAGAGALAVAFGKDAVSSASDLAESTNKVQQVFGDSAGAVFKFTEGAADAIGQSNVAARDAASTFGIFAHAADLSDKKAAKFSKRMTVLASDLASFHNTEPDEAVEALGAALRGESEPIRKYGVLLDDATLKAEALRLGLLEPVKDQAKIRSYQVKVLEGQKAYNDAVEEYGEKSLEALKAEANLGSARESLRKATEGTIPPLTQQQKVLAAQSSIFKQTEVAQGDFARTSDGFANQQRRLAAQFENTKAKLGEGLLPIVSEAAGFLLDKGVPAFQDFADWFTDKGIPAIGDFIDDAKPLANEILPAISSAFDTTKDAAKKIAPLLQGLFEGFNKLPDWVQSVIVLGAGAAALKSKLGGKSGLTGGLLGGISQLKPIPVFVTNPGGVDGGGVGGAGSKAGGAKAAAGAILAASPYLLPLLTSGDQAPGQKADFDTAHQGYVRLLQLTGANDGEELHDALLSATREQLAGYRKVLRDELGIGFKAIGQIQFDSGMPALPDGLTVGDIRKADDAWGDFFATASTGFKSLPKKVQVEFTTEGGPETMRDVKALQRQYDLTPKAVKTLVEVYGVDEAKRQVEVALTPFMVGRNPSKESQGSDAMLPAPSDVPSRGRRTSSRSGGVTINQHIGTVNDSKQLNKDAAAKAQQAAMGGWG